MRVIIIANRLPMKLTQSAGRIAFKRSEGGLATGLAPCIPMSKPIGWAGPACMWRTTRSARTSRR